MHAAPEVQKQLACWPVACDLWFDESPVFDILDPSRAYPVANYSEVCVCVNVLELEGCISGMHVAGAPGRGSEQHAAMAG